MGCLAPRAKHLVQLALVIVALTGGELATGPKSATAAEEFECRWVDAPLAIDGVADEPAWQAAQQIDRFYLPWLGDKARDARTATRARLLWDREFLYFTAEMDDADLFADVVEHDGQTWNNDVFELFFKPTEGKPGYYEFQVNAAGTSLDMFIPRREPGLYERYKGDGAFDWRYKTVLRGTLDRRDDRDQGWTVEGRIPWTDFLRTGGRPAVDERWKFALCRYDYASADSPPELSTCAPLRSKSTPDFHLHEDYATLKFVGPQASAASRAYGIDRWQPLPATQVVGTPEPPPPYRAKRVVPQVKFNFPIATVRQPGTSLFWVVHQPRPYSETTISRFDLGASEFQPETLIVADETAYDIVFHPQFAQNGYVYVGSNGPFSGEGAAKKTRVTRYQMSLEPPYRVDPASAKVIIEWPSNGHNGGAMAFGLDGMLYVTSGDGTSDSDTNLTGQGLDHLLAKVLRIDVDHPEPGKTYRVPADNPFVDRPGARGETWAYGLRNPWRMTVDPQSGRLWVGNNGQDLWEQVYLIRKGDNYGWSVMEGSHPFYLQRQAGPTPFVKPTAEHPHSDARSLTGGVVYHGRRFPELRGAYIYGDYSTGKIWGLMHSGEQTVWHKELADTTLAISGFALDADGELWICDHRGNHEGGFHTLEPQPAEAAQRTARFPRKLSQTGLFQSTPGHVPHPSLIPYSVNSPLWSDGAHKERYLALVGESPKIDVTSQRGWNFENGTVIVKSFALDETDDKAPRRWIETRLLVREDNEWVGYTYAWNNEQTEAELVGAAGLDREYTVDGQKLQWHYPSRTECMVCHSRAANFVLGLSTAQMNRDHDYGSVRDNQLRMLEHLGVLRMPWIGEATQRLRDQLQAAGVAADEVQRRVTKLTTEKGQREATGSTLWPVAPERLDKLADPYDDRAELSLRARSYLQSNCAHCHVEAGGGNAQIQLEHHIPLDKLRLIGERPMHHTFAIPDAKLIAPGRPAQSVLLHRVEKRGPGQMPPLATTRPDARAVELLRKWIESLP
ncbi:MAG: PQQ-dependent sugar dehydrogenase [Pirellulales bacterium]